MYSETTRSITVTVRPFYLEQHSSPAEGPGSLLNSICIAVRRELHLQSRLFLLSLCRSVNEANAAGTRSTPV